MLIEKLKQILMQGVRFLLLLIKNPPTYLIVIVLLFWYRFWDGVHNVSQHLIIKWQVVGILEVLVWMISLIWAVHIAMELHTEKKKRDWFLMPFEGLKWKVYNNGNIADMPLCKEHGFYLYEKDSNHFFCSSDKNEPFPELKRDTIQQLHALAFSKSKSILERKQNPKSFLISP